MLEEIKVDDDKGVAPIQEQKPVSLEVKDDRVYRTCPKCGHQWHAKKTAETCPGCKKYIGKLKEVKDAEPGMGIKVEGSLPELKPGELEGLKSEDKGKKSKTSKWKAWTPEMYGKFAALMPGVMAEITGCEGLALTNDEKALLGDCLKEVGDKYLPNLFGDYSAEGQLAIAVIGIGVSKYAVYSSWRKEQMKKGTVPNGSAKVEVSNGNSGTAGQ